MQTNQTSFWSIVSKTAVVHTVTYFLVGLLALILLQYGALFSVSSLSTYMRPTEDPWVMAGPLFQPLRGILFGSVVYLLRESLFGRRDGWLVMWWMFAALGIFSTFGPAPGSIEGLIYTRVAWRDQLAGLPEGVVQSLSLAGLVSFWVRHPEKRWMGWLLWIVFVLVMLLPILGLMTSQGRPS